MLEANTISAQHTWGNTTQPVNTTFSFSSSLFQRQMFCTCFHTKIIFCSSKLNLSSAFPWDTTYRLTDNINIYLSDTTIYLKTKEQLVMSKKLNQLHGQRSSLHYSKTSLAASKDTACSITKTRFVETIQMSPQWILKRL